MKKILLILICVVLGFSSAWADSTTDKKSITIKATASPASGGTVLVATKTATTGESTSALFTKWNWNGFVSDPNGAGVTSQHTGKSRYYEWSYWAVVTTRTASKTTGIYYRLNAYPNQGYYFQKWTGLVNVTGTLDEDGEEIVESTENPYQPDGDTYLVHKKAKTYYYNDDKTHNITAYFKPVTVDKMQIDGEDVEFKTLNTTDKLSYKETTITFTTTGADNMNDFVSNQVVLSGDSRFTIQSSNRNGNIVTVVVRFTDDDHHVMDGTLPSATVTLTSKGDATSKKTATITATSDLTPKITITPSPCDLTPDSPVAEGNTVSDTLTASAARGYANVCGAAIWSAAFSDPDSAALMGYSADFTNPKSIPVSFIPTVYSMNQANVKAKIYITTTYTDGSGKVITNKDSVEISADAGKVITIDGLTEAVMDFGIIDYTDTNRPVTQTFPVFSTLPAGNFILTDSCFNSGIVYANNFNVGSTAATDNVSVTVNSTLEPGDYQANLTYTENVAQDPIRASMDVKVSIKLAKPVVTTEASTRRVYLSWNEVYGATKYKVWSGNVVVTDTIVAGKSSYKHEVSQINGDSLENFIQYPFEVEAVYADDHVGNRKSDIVYETPGLPGEIRIDNVSGVEIFTGTEVYLKGDAKYGVFPYAKKRKVSFDRIFGTEGNPLFDELYIFGLTTDIAGGTEINAPSATVACNAKTPCYVYVKSGNVYKKDSEFDATCTRFDHGTSKKGKHLYFTGYCPFAYMGTKSTENGWMYFKGAKNETVDIYLDDCQIMGRYKTPTGANSSYIEYELILEADVEKLGGEQANESFLQGNSSVFLFTSTSTNSTQPYKPTFHIADNNHLKGQLGSYITRTTGKVTIVFVPITMDAGIGNIFTYSAPIAIKPQDLSTYTDLTLTDIWKDNTITNGYLRLDAQPMDNSTIEKVVAIDLGSANGSLTINGGQYHLRNSAADGTYTCNLAVGYRRFEKLVEKAGQKLLLHLYGFGGDMTDCKVTINSGTFTMYKNMYFNGEVVMGDSAYLGEDYYRDQNHFLDLRLPAGKQTNPSCINGGTFNGITNVCMCTQTTTTGASPLNAKGRWLCLQDVEILTENMNGSVNFAIPDLFDKGYTNNPKVNYDQTTANRVSYGEQYGGQSVNAYEKDVDGDSEVEKVVSLLLPGQACNDCLNCRQQKEALIYQWATAIPVFDVTKKVSGVDQSVQVGGSIHVKNSPAAGTTALDSITNQLLFLDAKGLEPYSMNLQPQGAKLSVNDADMPRGRISNKERYTIEDHLNLLKVVQADTWYTFVAPYDVHQISVIEIDEGVISTKNRSEAVKHQAQSNWRIFYNLQDFILPNEQGRTTSLTLPVLLAGSSAYILPLTHYNGTNLMSAHYYLYELDPDPEYLDANGHFSTDAAGTALNINWKPVAEQTSSTNPILEKGKVYAMQFPWCPMCNDDLNSRTDYDYWSNKMILFYGQGPQTIDGINSHSAILSATEALPAGKATLAGNFTLANMTAPSGAYVHQYVDIDPNDDDQRKQDWFIQPTPGYTVKPTEGYLLYTPVPGAQMPARISRSGQIEYDENVETGLPTIAGRNSLMLFGAYNGIEVLALHEQLVTVYNLQGNIIFQQYMAEGQQVYVATGTGVFIVRGESETIKVMVE